MTVPSSIFELAQLEVRNARADLAGRMQQFVPLYWLLANVFGMNDNDIESIIQGQEDDAVRMALNQAKGEVASQKYQQENLPPPAPAQVTPTEGTPEGQAAAAQAPAQDPAQAQQQPPPDAAQQQQQAAPQVAPPQESRRRAPAYIKSRNLHEFRRGGFTEKELFEGSSRLANKQSMEKLEQLLKNDKGTAHRLLEVRNLLAEMGSFQKPRK
jgi:hypothetical protein